jgi:type I restriction enzyme S subunit
MGLEHIESWSGRRIDDENANSDGVAARFQPDDVLFGKLRPYLAKVYLAQHEGLVSTEALVIRPAGYVDSAFLRYFMVSQDFIRTVDSSTYGSKMPRASWDFIGNLPMLLPNTEEQQTIARFLDHKTAQIDALIAKKQTLLEKLAEKRTALISHAVTKGLDPNVKMKDSGVEWLGQVPEHWDCPPLYCRYTVQLGKMLNEVRITGDYLYPYLRNIDVQWDSINYENLPYIDIKPDEHFRYLVNDGDLLVCEGGDIGRAAIVEIDDQKIGYQKALHRLRAATSQEVPRYMFYTLFWASKIGLFLADGNPNTIPHLTGERFRRYRFPCPPREEQLKIVSYLENQNAKLDAQSKKAIIAIEKLKEYRSALITQAVTGKIDVRNVKIQDVIAKGQAA